MFDLSTKALQWDQELELKHPPSNIDSERRQFTRMLEDLPTLATLRFQPYQNDEQLNYVEKLRVWISQFPEKDQPLAYVLAMHIVFVTQRQFETLQRRLMNSILRKKFMDKALADRGLKPFDYKTAQAYFTNEMDQTLFISNSDSADLNSFVHVNSEHFVDREKRSLVGPEVQFWTSPAVNASNPLATADQRSTALAYESKVLANDRHIKNKTRLVILEDFSGSGSDISKTLRTIHLTTIPVKEVIWVS
jgi:hypothetical protein